MQRSNCSSPRTHPHPAHRHQRAGVRTPLLVLVCLTLGLALSALWFHRSAGSHQGGTTIATITGELTESTKAIIEDLRQPVEIRYYSSLDPNTVDENTRAFAERVDHLLAQYDTIANSKLTITRVAIDVAPQTATRDGISAFNQAHGDSCFLGIAVVCGDRKESLSRLTPDWEAALESDLTRAIQRALQGTTESAAIAAVAAQPSVEVVAALKNELPDIATLTVEEGSQRLRDAALERFKSAVAEMQVQLQKAQQQLANARERGSASAIEAATKNLQQVQMNQADELKRISAELQSQIEVLTHIKQP
jgi:hypothetical protein